MDYQDFSIRFESKGGKRYKVRVESTAGNDDADIVLTHSVDEMLSLLDSAGLSLRSANEPNIDSAAAAQKRSMSFDDIEELPPAELGTELYRDLFTGATASKFDQALGSTQGREQGLRIRIHLDPNDPNIAELGSLPWELLCHPDMGDQPLALSKTTPVVRYLDSPRPHNFKEFSLPLKILVVVSNPSGVVALDLDKEQALIKEHCAKLTDVEVNFLQHATLDRLRKELESHQYHILHFMGHGDFSARDGVGVLLMETSNGEQDPVDGRSLGMLLQDAKSLRLVLLNACKTANLNQQADKDPYAGVASSLVLNGVPAVIAMQFPISDSAAIAFSDSLYEGLSKGAALETAVTEARKAIRVTQRDTLEWATPVLFMSTIDGRLFPSPSLREQRKQQFDPRKFATPAFGLLALIILILVASQFFLPEPSKLVLEGKVVDLTNDSTVEMASISIVELEDTKTISSEDGSFSFKLSRSVLSGLDELNIRYEKEGYNDNIRSVKIPQGRESPPVIELNPLPKNLSGCGGKRTTAVTIGNYSGARDSAAVQEAIRENLEESILVDLQLKKLRRTDQPAFVTCPDAKPQSRKYTGGFAKALRTDIFLFGKVSDTKPYDITTYLGDTNDLYDGEKSIGQSKDVEDPLYASIDGTTKVKLLRALARSYQVKSDAQKEEQGHADYGNCVYVATIALNQAATSDPVRADIKQQLEDCTVRGETSGLVE